MTIEDFKDIYKKYPTEKKLDLIIERAELYAQHSYKAGRAHRDGTNLEYGYYTDNAKLELEEIKWLVSEVKESIK